MRSSRRRSTISRKLSRAPNGAMNMRDPTDVVNVSVEGVGERMQMARAAERMQEP
eukprot:CAMPEP_0179910590 /NCGR_PEP_ID=MMETSP0982-20121206/45851_1 /TAXON_ID=483367 /ORGANISM="non described non described, Strain CCMP 2436" /LENGTH=54 /DNA_ID=CAMNT_0021812159 /DNA_START=254 /DNA_END=414 /DNA_ORIENTATION=+